MKMLNFAKRSLKEIIRDPLCIIFALLLPIFLLFIFSRFNIPSEVYRLENFTPGIIIFGYAFISMFTATLVSKDRGSSLLIRLGVSPMRGIDYVGGYILSVLPIAAAQILLFFGAALLLGLDFSLKIIFALLASLPMAMLFISLGIIIGSVTSESASAGLSSVVIQLVAFTSGMYFDSGMVGKAFSAVCDVLPFSHAVSILRAFVSGEKADPLSAVIFGIYTLFSLVFAGLLLGRKRTS